MSKLDKAFDKFWSGFDKLWDQFGEQLDKILDEELPETTKVSHTVRIRVKREHLTGLLTGQHKSLLFKVKDGVAIRVEMQP